MQKGGEIQNLLTPKKFADNGKMHFGYDEDDVVLVSSPSLTKQEGDPDWTMEFDLFLHPYSIRSKAIQVSQLGVTLFLNNEIPANSSDTSGARASSIVKDSARDFRNETLRARCQDPSVCVQVWLTSQQALQQLHVTSGVSQSDQNSSYATTSRPQTMSLRLPTN